MSIDRLLAIMRPPQLPREVPSQDDWRLVETRFGPLPADYHAFMATYGTGAIDGFIWVTNPASENQNLHFEHKALTLLDAIRGLNARFSQSALPLHPTPGGLLPCALTDNGDLILWETNGQPYNWTVAVLPTRELRPLRFSMNLTEFLRRVLAKELHCDAFPEDFPSNKPTFVQCT